MSQQTLIDIALECLFEEHHWLFFREIARDWGYGDPIKEEAMWNSCSEKERLAILNRLMNERIVTESLECSRSNSRMSTPCDWSKGTFHELPDELQIYIFLSCDGDEKFTVEAIELNVREYCSEQVW